jgi:ferrous iron transport protein A
MEGVMTGAMGTSVATAQAHASHASSQLPLSMVHEGETVHVARVRGNGEFARHLATLGFVEGASVKVVARGNGDTIVCVKGSQLGLNRDTASHVITC